MATLLLLGWYLRLQVLFLVMLQMSHAFTSMRTANLMSRTTQAIRLTNVGRFTTRSKTIGLAAKDIVVPSIESTSRLRIALELHETMVYVIGNPCDWISSCEIHEIDYNESDQCIKKEWVLVRPKLKETLELLSEHADLDIYSAGSKPFVEAVAKVIDPSGRYFKKKVGDAKSISYRYCSNKHGADINCSHVIYNNDFLATRTVLIDTANDYLKSDNGLIVHPFHGYRYVIPFNGDLYYDLYDVAKLIVEKLVPAPDIRTLIQRHRIKT